MSSLLARPHLKKTKNKKIQHEKEAFAKRSSNWSNLITLFLRFTTNGKGSHRDYHFFGRTFLKNKSKMNGIAWVFKSLRRHVERKRLMRFQCGTFDSKFFHKAN